MVRNRQYSPKNMQSYVPTYFYAAAPIRQAGPALTPLVPMGMHQKISQRARYACQVAPSPAITPVFIHSQRSGIMAYRDLPSTKCVITPMLCAKKMTYREAPRQATHIPSYPHDATIELHCTRAPGTSAEKMPYHKMPSMSIPPPSFTRRCSPDEHQSAHKQPKSTVPSSSTKKPIVILVSVKEVEKQNTDKDRIITNKRHTRVSLRHQVEQQLSQKHASEEAIEKTNLSRYCALDAEMVGVGSDGKRSVLARITVVNFKGVVLIDSLVKPEEDVTDYRTTVTGIQKGDLDRAPSYSEIRIRVIDLIQDKIVIGHALENDFKVLGIGHPAEMIRDTAFVKILRQKLNRPIHLMPSLKLLVASCLPPDFEFRKGKAHDPVEDARAPLEIFKRFRKDFEQQIAEGFWTCSPSFYEAQ